MIFLVYLFFNQISANMQYIEVGYGTILIDININTKKLNILSCSWIEMQMYRLFTIQSQSYHYVSQFTVETYCFADGRCLLKQPQSVIYHWNQYDEEISKKCRSARLSVCPFVTLNKKAYFSFIIDSRKIIRISGERVWHPLQENEAIFSKNIFQKF